MKILAETTTEELKELIRLNEDRAMRGQAEGNEVSFRINMDRADMLRQDLRARLASESQS